MKTRRVVPICLLALLLNLVLAARSTAATLYVSAGSTNPVPPYADWSTAAINIQDAVDASTNGDTVLVTNGVYASGGKNWFSSGTNRVTLANTITLQSVNGPEFTWIAGNTVAGTGTALTNAARCVAIGSSAVLSGFTLTNGEAGTGNYPNGGGVAQVQSVSAAGTVTNCVLIGNLSTNGVGGGAYRVKLIDCQIIGNYATSGGGACACTLFNCTVVSNTASSGGGVYGDSTLGISVLTNCTLTGNTASGYGGGAYLSSLSSLANCVVISNRATRGGGLEGGSATNCIFTGDSAQFGGASETSVLVNCVVAGNSSTSGVLQNCASIGCTIVSNSTGVTDGSLLNSISYYNGSGDASGVNSITNCCIPSISSRSGNFSNAPLFVNLAAGDFHLSSNSPCINSGNNAFVTSSTDLDGNPRIVGGTVDMGAYEYQSPVSRISYAWLQYFGIPITTNTDTTDTDGDGMNNYSEWVAGTNPTNPASLLLMQFPSNNVSGLTVSWQSVTNRTYYLQRATDLGAAPAFSALKSNIVGKAGTTSYPDTTATNSALYFYRVGVQ